MFLDLLSLLYISSCIGGGCSIEYQIQQPCIKSHLTFLDCQRIAIFEVIACVAVIKDGFTMFFLMFCLPMQAYLENRSIKIYRNTFECNGTPLADTTKIFISVLLYEIDLECV